VKRYTSLAALEADPELTTAALDEILEFTSQLGDQLAHEQAAVRIVRAAASHSVDPVVSDILAGWRLRP
jgi:hypothetical protein